MLLLMAQNQIETQQKLRENGAKSFEEVQEKTEVGTGCGHCVENNKALVDELLGK